MMLFVVLTAVFFWPIFFRFQVFSGADILLRGYFPWMALDLIPSHLWGQNPELSDPVFSFVPNMMYAVKLVARGEVPLWNVLKMCGMPQLADGTTPIFFPLNVFYFIGLHPLIAGTIKIILEIILMGFFCYVLGLEFRLDKTGALVAALIAVYASTMVGWLEFYAFLDTRVWYPAILICAERYLKQKRSVYSWLGALSCGCMMLSLNLKDISYFLHLYAAYFFLRIAMKAPEAPDRRIRFSRGVIFSLSIFSLGAALGAVQLLPMLEFSKFCSRAPVVFRFISLPEVFQQIHDTTYSPLFWYTHFDAPWRFISLFSFILPKFFGAAQDNFFWTANPYVEHINYLGILPLILILACLIAVRKKPVLFMIAAAALCYLLWAYIPGVIQLYDFLTAGLMQGKGALRLKYVMTFSLAYAVGYAITLINHDSGKERDRFLKWASFLSVVMIILALIGMGGIFFFGDVFYDWMRRTHFLGVDEVGGMLRATGNESSGSFPEKRLLLIYQFVQFGIFFFFALASYLYFHWSRKGKPKEMFRNGLCILAVFLDLFLFGHNYNPTISLREAYPPTKITDFLKKDTSLFRIFRYKSQNVLTAGAVNAYGIQDAGGRSMSLYVKKTADVLAMAGPEKEALSGLYPCYFRHPEEFESRLWNLLNIKYIVASEPPAFLDRFWDSDLEEVFNFYDHFTNAVIEAPQKNYVAQDQFAIQQDLRPVVLQNPPSQIIYNVLIPKGAKLRFSIGMNPAAWKDLPIGLKKLIFQIILPEKLLRSDGMIFKVFGENPQKVRTLLFQKTMDPLVNAQDREWRDVEIDLSAYENQRIKIYFQTEPGISGNSACDWGGWSGLSLIRNREDVSRVSPLRKRYAQVFRGEGLYLYENKTVLPRAFVLHNSRVMTDDEAEKAIRSFSFDPRKFAILAGGKTLSGSKHYLTPVEIAKYDANSVRMKTQPREPGYLILSDTYYPGWRVFVDGKESAIERAFYTFRAVYLEPGNHEIEMVYRPASYRIGGRLSLLSLGLLLLWGGALLIKVIFKKRGYIQIRK